MKRPTASASEITADELAYGKSLLISKLETVQPEIVRFTFKKTANVTFGAFAGYGFIGRPLAGGEAFVMPGPYERADRVDEALETLAQRWRTNAS